MRAPTWFLGVIFAGMSVAAVAMMANSTRRFAFKSPEEERRFWVKQMKAEMPIPALATMWNIYQCRPEQELRDCLASEDPDVAAVAADALWNIWLQALGPETESRLNEATIMFEDGLTSQALDLCETLAQARCEETPQEAEIYSLRGRIRLSLGQYERGVKDCKIALSMNERHWPTLRAWMNAAIQQHDSEGLIEALARLASTFPGNKSLREMRDRTRTAIKPVKVDNRESR